MAESRYNLAVNQNIDEIGGELEEAGREVSRLQRQLEDGQGVAARQGAEAIRVRKTLEEIQQLRTSSREVDDRLKSPNDNLWPSRRL